MHSLGWTLIEVLLCLPRLGRCFRVTCPLGSWAKKRLTELLQGIEYEAPEGSVEVVKVENLEGDSEVQAPSLQVILEPKHVDAPKHRSGFKFTGGELSSHRIRDTHLDESME